MGFCFEFCLAPIRSSARPAIRRSLSTMRLSAEGTKKLVFLGSPTFAADSLKKLNSASKAMGYELSLVVTQPPQPAGRKRILTPTPVHAVAEELEIDVLTPPKASDPDFIEFLEKLEPDLCVTAAYGNFLPSKFLRIPRHGTINIHPSLLPLFRGAAPVPRALEAGVDTTGVTIMFTVLEMDAGPIISQREVTLKGDEKSHELLDSLFDIGTDEVLNVIPSIFDATVEPVEQDHSKATHADKMRKEEGVTAFTENAVRIHNKIRAFAGWPGVWAEFISETAKGVREELRIKLITSRVHEAEGGPALGVHEINLGACKDALRVVCDDGSVLDILELQPQGKKPMPAKQFKGSLQGKTFSRKRVPH
mmetsp:Transcript_44373/g.172499  ORF Transcript_44373/g.172499 Transcript_44373/m.172499 type:complete len:364 (-) Transcript_44373:1494-2585(-)